MSPVVPAKPGEWETGKRLRQAAMSDGATKENPVQTGEIENRVTA